MTAAAWDAWTREGAHPCYQVRLTGPSHDARSLVDMPSENVTEFGAWQATLAAHDDMANGGATDPRRSADGWYEVAVWRVVGEGQQRIVSVILPPLARRAEVPQ